ncbi:MAG: HAD family phosphatase [Bacteroidales bacterium]|nr:HAD family phosphatase [Bacteroidales bacterium]
MIKNLILDMGGVILGVDYSKVFTGFKALGVDNLEHFFTQQTQIPLVDKFEVGEISSEEFREGVREITQKNLSDKDIDFAWNSMVLLPRKEDILFIQEEKTKYKGVYLFSNTNAIHLKYVKDLFLKTMGFDVFKELFTKVYFSNEIHERKPNLSSFNYVIDDAKLNKEETLFIDDTPQNVLGAEKAGIHSALLPAGKTLRDLKQEGILL